MLGTRISFIDEIMVITNHKGQIHTISPPAAQVT
jgi:hypothetical protein